MPLQPSQPASGAAQEDSARRNQAAIALAEAMARARSRQAEEEVARAGARLSGTQRLEALRHQLAPLYAAIPREVELFNLGMTAGDRPKLFVDIIAFIEAGADGSVLRFIQETRSGRQVLLETDNDIALRQAVTDYIARRLIERERTLATAETIPSSTVATGPEPVHIDRPTNPEPPRVVAAEASVPPPLVVEPAPPVAKLAMAILPQTANQAFERWTGAMAQAAPLPAIATKALAATDARPAPDAEEELAAVRRELAELTVAETNGLATSGGVTTPAITEKSIAPTASSVADPVVAAPASPLPLIQKPEVSARVSTVLESSPSITAAPVAVTASPASVARSGYAPRPPSNTGWWLLPLLAMMVGIALGALLLYLYAANILKP